MARAMDAMGLRSEKARRAAGAVLLGVSFVAALSLAACGTAVKVEVADMGKHRVEPPASAQSDVAGLAAGDTAFALDLFRAVRSDSNNVVSSPYSISTALAMAYAGARGQTEKEMAAVLHFTLSPDRLHPAFNQLGRSLNSASSSAKDGFELTTANSLWGQRDAAFAPDFLQLLVEQYGSPLRKVDFVQATEPARQAINQWVEEQTKNKIKDLLPQGSLDTSTRLVLANAIYFKAKWASPFKHESTQPGTFHAQSGDVTAQMMHQGSSFGYAKEEGFQAVQLPYKGDRFSMIALLPDGNLADAVKSLTPESLSRVVGSLAPTGLELEMPKWTYDSGFQLKDALTALGMPHAFENADFSGMGGKEPLAISDVYHKAFVAVDEEGTEAAAATGVVMGATAAAPPPQKLVLDRPFLYLIYDNDTASILFLGQVMDPSARVGAGS
jgi:serpin B